MYVPAPTIIPQTWVLSQLSPWLASQMRPNLQWYCQSQGQYLA